MNGPVRWSSSIAALLLIPLLLVPGLAVQASGGDPVQDELEAEASYLRLGAEPQSPAAPVVLPGDLVYFSDFEATNGGLLPTLDWTWGTYAWNGATCDSSNYPPASAYSGTGMWGTRLNTCYQNLGNNAGFAECSNTNLADDSILTLSLDLTGYTGATMSFWEWYDLFSYWDWAEVYANGTPVLQHCESSFVQPTAWVQQVVDLTPFAGGPVTIEFHMMASTVVNHAGWFIDDLAVNATGADNTLTCGVILAQPAVDPYGRILLRWKVEVLDQNMANVPQVAVDADLWWPTGGPASRTRLSHYDGFALFPWGSAVSGTWTLDVTNMTLAGYTFADGANCTATGIW